jgi:hypothetical protein
MYFLGALSIIKAINEAAMSIAKKTRYPEIRAFILPLKMASKNTMSPIGERIENRI